MAVTAALYVCWGLVCVIWLIGAAVNRRRGPAVQERASRDWTIYVAAGAIALASVVPARAWHRITLADPRIHDAGAALLIIATAFTLWARLALGVMWSSAVVAKQDHSLRTDGPYRLTRHPIYTGLFGMLAGSALAAGLGESAFVAAAIVVALVFKACTEERLLLGTFPGDYERYRGRVPMFIPGLRPPRPPRP